MTWRMLLFLESTNLPSQDIFGKSLYTFYIGQNDFTSNLTAIGIGGVKQYLPQVVSQIAGTIKVNYLLIMQHVLWLTTHKSCKPTKMVQPNTFPVILLVGKEAHWPLFCTKPMLFLVGPFKASPIYIFILYKYCHICETISLLAYKIDADSLKPLGRQYFGWALRSPDLEHVLQIYWTHGPVSPKGENCILNLLACMRERERERE